MKFDHEGHILISPREVQDMALSDRVKLINSILIPGTPRAILTHENHHRLLHHISEKMGIHPNNLFFKGSTKIGFSIAPKAAKVWMGYGPSSDLDLAIVDGRFFQIVDYEVGRWERNPDNKGKIFQNRRLFKDYGNRIRNKGKYDCFRFFDLPKIPCMEELDECLDSAPVQACCGSKRPLRAFIFRDWWGVCKRYDFDLYCLCRDLNKGQDPLPTGGDDPRPYEEESDSVPDDPDELVHESRTGPTSGRVEDVSSTDPTSQ